MDVPSTRSIAVWGRAFCKVAAKLSAPTLARAPESANWCSSSCAADRILQQVGHHQRDTVALAQPVGVQPRGKVACQGVQFGVADRLAHADVGGLVRKAAATFLHDRDQRRYAVHLDLRGNARGIALVPDSFHRRA
ncbi:hypothetical protein G6F57_021995 [Rhizopus arrhizus]|nr:hypothetical protein G6F57_021995 [Rhizopus arrhizus]